MPPFCIDLTSTTNLVLFLVINYSFMFNVDTILSVISSMSLSINSGKAIAGFDPHPSYGTYQCPADLSNVDDQYSIRTAAPDIIDKKYCPSRYEDLISYDQCMLRNSNISNAVQPITWGYSEGRCWAVQYLSGPSEDMFSSRNEESPESTCSTDNLTSTNNLTDLLTHIAPRAGSTGFYNEIQSQFSILALCRGDLPVPSDDCLSCLNKASSSITDNYCPSKTWGTVWYEKCLIRYSNVTFLGTVDDDAKVTCGPEKVPSDVWDDTTILAMQLVRIAANRALMFAADEKEVGDPLHRRRSYVLVQCTRDLNREGCEKCFDMGMSVVTKDCKQTNAWKYLSGSCTIRYEEFPFFRRTPQELRPLEPPEELAPQPKSPKKRGGILGTSNRKVGEILGSIPGIILFSSLLYLLWWLSKRKTAKTVPPNNFNHLPNMDLLFVDLNIIQTATSDFSDANKLGEGGFGPVYKGTLRDGREIAVKRLSTKSRQGDSEFKNEVKLIANLQHRNLVRVLGCCVEREEKLLIYEYMPNKSLDSYIFDENERSKLDWARRCHIIAGIAKGLLYLHEDSLLFRGDSLLKVIHMDLKPSNVLLDNAMNPKISDFGMAKIIEMEETGARTGRIAGTLGYMAPEYVTTGVFSEKSDVYSFGVLLLEILSGQKNGRSHFEQHGQTLMRRACQLWREERAMELMDTLLRDSYPPTEVMKVIQIGLLCVQENVEERPIMSYVVLMLRSEQMVLPEPTESPYPLHHRTFEPELNSSDNKCTINEITITNVSAR